MYDIRHTQQDPRDANSKLQKIKFHDSNCTYTSLFYQKIFISTNWRPRKLL